jgi:hypothetical protein
MSDETDDDQDLWDALSPLAAMVPTPGRTDAILRSARHAAGRRAWMGWGLATAAALAVAIGGAVWVAQPASAAEQLAQAADASDRYTGWVHSRVTDGHGQLVAIEHIDTRTGFSVQELHEGGHVYFHLYDRAARRMAVYDGSEHTLYVGPIDAGFADHERDAMRKMPWTLAEATAQIPGTTVRRGTDGDQNRFDLTFPPDDAKTAAAQHRTVYPSSVSLWVDPATNLIVRAAVAGIPGEETITYGTPGPTDIYAAGAPRDAKVVDRTPPKDATELLARLRRRHDAGLGDGVAILTDVTRVIRPGHPVAFDRSLKIFGTSGPARSVWAFRVDDPDAAPNATVRSVDLPQWPTPSIDAVLAATAGKVPRTFIIVSGRGPVWQGRSQEGNGTIESSDIGQLDRAMWEHAVDVEGLPSILWPAADLKTFGTDGTTTMLPADAAHPGRIGIRVEQDYYTRAPADTHLVMVYWFDPGNDDVVVDRTDDFTAVKASGRTDRSRDRLSDFAGTADGKRYPTRRLHQFTDNPGKKGETSYGSVEYLHVDAGRQLPPNWYANPAVTRPSPDGPASGTSGRRP